MQDMAGNEAACITSLGNLSGSVVSVTILGCVGLNLHIWNDLCNQAIEKVVLYSFWIRKVKLLHYLSILLDDVHAFS